MRRDPRRGVADGRRSLVVVADELEEGGQTRRSAGAEPVARRERVDRPAPVACSFHARDANAAILGAMALALRVLPETFAIVRLDATDGMPAWWADGASFASVTRRGKELSIVCAEEAVPQNALADRGWRGLELVGTQDLAETGVLASLAWPLADARVPLFALATYDTDVVLVPGARLEDATEALTAAGVRVGYSA